MTEVLLGAANWLISPDDLFYPEDLPADWRLTFYANEYLTTVLDCALLQSDEQREQLAEQLADCHDSFRPVLKVDANLCSISQLASVFDWLNDIDEALGYGRLAGVWLTGNGTDPDPWRAVVPDSLPLAYDADEDGRARDLFPVAALGSNAGNGMPSETWLATLTLGELDDRRMTQAIHQWIEQASGFDRGCLLVIGGYNTINDLLKLATILRLMQG